MVSTILIFVGDHAYIHMYYAITFSVRFYLEEGVFEVWCNNFLTEPSAEKEPEPEQPSKPGMNYNN